MNDYLTVKHNKIHTLAKRLLLLYCMGIKIPEEFRASISQLLDYLDTDDDKDLKSTSYYIRVFNKKGDKIYNYEYREGYKHIRMSDKVYCEKISAIVEETKTSELTPNLLYSITFYVLKKKFKKLKEVTYPHN